MRYEPFRNLFVTPDAPAHAAPRRDEVNALAALLAAAGLCVIGKDAIDQAAERLRFG